MNKKIIFPLIMVLLLGVGGVFWWQDQAEVRELNKNLPEEVRVVKGLFGQEYKVVNKIDGYEFKVPEGWKGIEEIEYTPKRVVEGFVITSIGVEGKEGEARDIAIDRYESEKENIELESWAKELFNIFKLSGEFIKDKLENIDIVKTQESEHLLGMYIYFFKKNKTIYVISGGSEEFIRDIILNGKW